MSCPSTRARTPRPGTVQLAPDQMVAARSLRFADEVRAIEIEDQVIQIERNIQAAHPEVVALFVKPLTGRDGRLPFPFAVLRSSSYCRCFALSDWGLSTLVRVLLPFPPLSATSFATSAAGGTA
jgi:hypothetical protein